jgi:aspartate/methionine/tyrosine aminotransferase
MGFLDVGRKKWEDLARDPNLIHMGHNCNQLELDPAIHEAMIRAIQDDDYRNYTPPYGFEELRTLMQEDVEIPGTEIMVTQGATEAIYQAMATILAPGDQAIVSDPAWPHIATFARSLGAEVVEIPIYSSKTNWKLSPDLVREYITPRTKLVAVIDPLNPLGSSYSEEEIKELCTLAEEHGAYVLHDATYRDYAQRGHFPATRYYDRAVMNISLSKICGFAGLRVGATIASPGLLRRIAEKQVGRLGGNWVAQQGAIAAYRSKMNWRPRVLEINRRNQETLRMCIDDISGVETIVYPSSGNFLAVDVSGTGHDAEAVVRAGLDVGFVIRSGVYTSKRYGNEFVRITTTVPSENVVRFCELFPGVIRQLGRAA